MTAHDSLYETITNDLIVELEQILAGVPCDADSFRVWLPGRRPVYTLKTSAFRTTGLLCPAATVSPSWTSTQSCLDNGIHLICPHKHALNET